MQTVNTIGKAYSKVGEAVSDGSHWVQDKIDQGVNYVDHHVDKGLDTFEHSAIGDNVVGHAAAHYVKSQVHFDGGIVKGATGLVTGLGGLAGKGLQLQGGEMQYATDAKYRAQTNEKFSNFAHKIAKNPGAIPSNIYHNVKAAYQHDPDDFAGRAVGVIGGTILTAGALGAAGGAGEAGEALEGAGALTDAAEGTGNAVRAADAVEAANTSGGAASGGATGGATTGGTAGGGTSGAGTAGAAHGGGDAAAGVAKAAPPPAPEVPAPAPEAPAPSIAAKAAKGGSKAKASAPAAPVAQPEILPNADKAVIDSRKLTDYALNPESTTGGADKARVFQSALGYNKSNWESLYAKIQEGIAKTPGVAKNADKFGQRYAVDMDIVGANGNTASVRTGWILKPGSDTPEMTTVFVNPPK